MSKRFFKEKGQEKEEDGYQGQLLEINYFISQAEHHGGDEKYSLIKQMIMALRHSLQGIIEDEGK